MNPELCLKVGLSSRKKAESYHLSKNTGKAFSHYLLALKLHPPWKCELKETFNEVLCDWIGCLTESNRSADAVTCYSQAIEIFPENEYVYYSYGHFLLKYNSYGALPAISNFKKCIELNRWNLLARRSLENSLNLAVERWHFRMLNDELRNRAFWEAILKKIQNGYSDVLDIGTGTGLLSLFAVENGARNVYACDSSPVMIHLAKDIIEENCSGEVTIIEKHSTDLKVGQDLKDRVSLIVCEIVDCGLLGEHVLDTLQHAWRYLLKPSGKILPFAATFYVCGIESQYLSKKYFFKENYKKLDLRNFILIKEDSDYDTEHLELLPGSFRTLTDTISVLTVNFNSLSDIEKVQDGEKNISITLTCQTRGELTCIAGWFDLQLDEDIVIHTKPGSDVKCWDQAIFSCPEEIRLAPGQTLELAVSFKGGNLKVEFPEVKSSKEKVVVSENVLTMLNDFEYMSALFAAAEELPTNLNKAVLLDTSPFPALGLSYLLSRTNADKLFCVCQKPGERMLVNSLAESVGAQVEYIEANRICDGVKDQLFDIIYLSVIEKTGEFNESLLLQLPEIRKLLKPGGILLPERISVYGQLIESQWVKRNSQVLNKEVTCNYDIASHINQYKVDHHLDFRLESCDRIDRSDPFKIMDLNLNELEEQSSSYAVPVTYAGQVDAVPYWYDVLCAAGSFSKFSTKSVRSHFNTSALLVDLTVHENLNLITKYGDGILITQVD